MIYAVLWDNDSVLVDTEHVVDTMSDLLEEIECLL